MDGKTYGILEEDYNNPCNPNRFVRKYIDFLEEIMENPQNKIIYSDITPSGEYITKTLKTKNFKNAILYHLDTNHSSSTLYNIHFLNIITYKHPEKIIRKIKESSDEIIYL